MTDDLKQIWAKVDQVMGPQRMETEAEHIARDMREGRFPQRSDPIQVLVNPTPTPNELVTAEQAAALLEFYSRFKRVIPQDKAEKDASAALRTVIALHEALAAANARAVCPIGILPEAQKLCSAGTCDVCTASLRDRLVAAEARHDDDRHELNRITTELGVAIAAADAERDAAFAMGMSRAAAEARADAAEARAARRSFPILKGGGAAIDYQLVADHAEQARSNHYQSVDRLAERGGLSWCELYAVLHNQRWEKMETNEAMIACRSLEARYLAALETGAGDE